MSQYALFGRLINAFQTSKSKLTSYKMTVHRNQVNNAKNAKRADVCVNKHNIYYNNGMENKSRYSQGQPSTGRKMEEEVATTRGKSETTISESLHTPVRSL